MKHEKLIELGFLFKEKEDSIIMSHINNNHVIVVKKKRFINMNEIELLEEYYSDMFFS